MTTILAFAFVLGVLIFVHEFGHFATAKMVGIKVERFSLGFPPRMFGKKIGDTDYCISWLPLGGYVKMAGMIDESLDGTIEGEPWEFASKPVWQRLIVISAGSIMNILTAVVILALIAFAIGIPGESDGALVSEVLENKPAETVGLKTGDVIVSINDQLVKTQQDLIKIVNANPGVELPIEWKRESESFSSRITPELQEEENIGLIGVRVGNHVVYQEAGLVDSFKAGFSNTYSFTKLILYSLKVIFTGEQSFKDAVGGPIAVLVDGVPLTMGWDHRTDLSIIPLTAARSIHLLRGLSSLLYGPNVLAGVVSVDVARGVERLEAPPAATLSAALDDNGG
ncbi:site-2 protease family protein, partial [candidate division KSB1 bacterium]|nr:site-2 protease family protein [candidate division KSB1 bacterium]